MRPGLMPKSKQWALSDSLLELSGLGLQLGTKERLLRPRTLSMTHHHCVTQQDKAPALSLRSAQLIATGIVRGTQQPTLM